jgi:hypothetical protein
MAATISEFTTTLTRTTIMVFNSLGSAHLATIRQQFRFPRSRYLHLDHVADRVFRSWLCCLSCVQQERRCSRGLIRISDRFSERPPRGGLSISGARSSHSHRRRDRIAMLYSAYRRCFCHAGLGAIGKVLGVFYSLICSMRTAVLAYSQWLVLKSTVTGFPSPGP